MIDAVRVAGGMLVVALYMNTKSTAVRLDPVEVEHQRRRILDYTVLHTVIG